MINIYSNMDPTNQEIIQLQKELQKLQEHQRVMLEQQRKMVTTINAVSTICRQVMEKNTTLTQEIIEMRGGWTGDSLRPNTPMIQMDQESDDDDHDTESE